MFGAAIGVGEEVVDSSACFEETGAGKFDFKMATAAHESLREILKEVKFLGWIIEAHKLDFAK